MTRSLTMAALFGGAMTLATGAAYAQAIEITVSTKAETGAKEYFVVIEGERMKCPARSKASCRDLVRYSREYPGLLSSKSATRKLFTDGVNHNGSEPSSDGGGSLPSLDISPTVSAEVEPVTSFPTDEYDYEYEYETIRY